MKYIGTTDVGRKRHENEDRYLLNPEIGLFALADGMGGHAAGNLAADLTIHTINDFVSCAIHSKELTWPFGYNIQLPFEYNVLSTALKLANLKVSQRAREMTSYEGMGSTVVVTWLRGRTLYFSHAGDSRIYRFHNRKLLRLTEDHSFVQEQLRRGLISESEAKTHMLRHIVTRAIGSLEKLEIEVQEEVLDQGDLILLCSDGLSDPVDDQVIEKTLLEQSDLKQCSRKLVALSLEEGGDDNVTVVLIEID